MKHTVARWVDNIPVIHRIIGTLVGITALFAFVTQFNIQNNYPLLLAGILAALALVGAILFGYLRIWLVFVSCIFLLVTSMYWFHYRPWCTNENIRFIVQVDSDTRLLVEPGNLVYIPKPELRLEIKAVPELDANVKLNCQWETLGDGIIRARDNCDLVFVSSASGEIDSIIVTATQSGCTSSLIESLRLIVLEE
jgi:energy-coupling factor transporter transmembrane protein EcfT